KPKTADAPVFDPQRSPRCSVAMLGPESRDRKGQSPKMPAPTRRGEPRPGGPARGGKSDRRALAPLPDATETTQTYRQTSGSYRRRRDQEQARPCRYADGSDEANPRPGASPNPTRRGTRDSETAHRGPEGSPRENPAAPTALGLGRMHDPFPARRGP